MKAINRILFVAYGNHPAAAEKREQAKLILERLHNNGLVSRAELMTELGLDPESKRDRDSFSELIGGLRGGNANNPLNVVFVTRRRIDGELSYMLSRDAFDASFGKLRDDILYLIEQEPPVEHVEERIIDKLLWITYANHSQTAGKRADARKLITELLACGELKKAEILRVFGLQQTDENDDRQFRRTLQWLTGNWKDERKSPLHVTNHAFVLSRRLYGQTAYYELAPGEFRKTTNVVMKNIRDFLSQPVFEELHELREEVDRLEEELVAAQDAPLR